MSLLSCKPRYATLSYKICENEALEIGYTKIALYISDEGLPTHAARQLRSGMWTSKIGALADIQHKLQGLTGERYGKVGQVLRRPL